MGDEGAAKETIGDLAVGGINSHADDIAGHDKDDAASLAAKPREE
jgi:hypothetical protein